MFRFYFVITVSMPFIIYYVLKIRRMKKHMDRYSAQYRYGVARNMVNITMRNARARVKCYGLENLPEDGGYIMYPNHQGKFDALGIIHSHDAPCSIVMDEERSKMILTNEFMEVLDGIRLNMTDLRKQLVRMRLLAERVEKGCKYILFPEGGYHFNGNHLQEFKPGAFKAAVWSKRPIVPVAIVDAYKLFDFNSLRRITVQVHFLKPLYYEEYCDLNTGEIAELVKQRIQETIEKAAGEKSTGE